VVSVDALGEELEAYEEMKAELLEKYRGKVVAIKDGRLVGVYNSEKGLSRMCRRNMGLPQYSSEGL